MQIHTVEEKETLDDIARAWGVPKDTLEKNNGLSRGERPAVGEELLILTPTRTYTARDGDSLERLSMRFGIRRCELLGMNPSLFDGISKGDVVILKYDERTHGMAASNGTLYKGYSNEALRRALPYLTYVSVAEAVADGDDIRETFDSSEALALINDHDKVPLLRIYDGGDAERYKDSGWREHFIEKMITVAKKKGYKGITYAGTAGRAGDASRFAEFILELRKRMIGCDLILITEITDSTPLEVSELADGSILSYDKCARTEKPSFENGEKAAYGRFACDGESSKTFIELPAFASDNNGFIPSSDAIASARRGGCRIDTDKDSLISSFTARRTGKTSYNSLKNIKARLDLLSELGFMGISFDIMRTPISYLMMYNALFKTVSYTGIRPREGCSRGYGG